MPHTITQKTRPFASRSAVCPKNSSLKGIPYTNGIWNGTETADKKPSVRSITFVRNQRRNKIRAKSILRSHGERNGGRATTRRVSNYGPADPRLVNSFVSFPRKELINDDTKPLDAIPSDCHAIAFHFLFPFVILTMRRLAVQ